MSITSLIEQIERFAEGQTSREQLRASFIPFLEAYPRPETDADDEEPTWSPDEDAKLLYSNLVFLFESTDRTVDEERVLARQVTKCFHQTLSPASTLDILPLIRSRDRFCKIVGKHRAGVVSRTGLRSVIKKSFTFDTVREWLESASVQQLEQLCEVLSAEDYMSVERIVSQPPT